MPILMSVNLEQLQKLYEAMMQFIGGAELSTCISNG